MRLKDSLYKVTDSRLTEGGAEYDIRLNPEHFIYAAHFPGEPITPGVCIMQTGVELLSNFVGAELELRSVKSIKFLKIISPDDVTELTWHIGKVQDGGGEVKAQFIVTSGEDVYAKLSLTCVEKSRDSAECKKLNQQC